MAVGDHRVTLSKDTIGELVEGLQFFSLMHPEEDLGLAVTIRAALYQQRCLEVYLSEHEPGGNGSYDKELLVLFDMHNQRPFAFFSVTGDYMVRLPPVWYRADWAISRQSRTDCEGYSTGGSRNQKEKYQD